MQRPNRRKETFSPWHKRTGTAGIYLRIKCFNQSGGLLTYCGIACLPRPVPPSPLYRLQASPPLNIAPKLAKCPTKVPPVPAASTKKVRLTPRNRTDTFVPLGTYPIVPATTLSISLDFTQTGSTADWATVVVATPTQRAA